jgi:hypothetical protein
MTRRQGKPWQPMRRARLVTPPALADRARRDPATAQMVADCSEVWRNDQYVVIVRRRDDGTVMTLSIRRDDRAAVHDWRHFQRIKNEICGPDAEAVELYPAENRLVDEANSYWLWCLPPGERWPLGFPARSVGDDTNGWPGARQRPLDQELPS